MSVLAPKRPVTEPASQAAAGTLRVARRRRSRLGIAIALATLLLLSMVGASVFWIQAPSAADLPARVSTIAAAGDGVLKPAQVPPVLAQAVIAAEDERFYVHHGLDTLGTGRAIWDDLARLCACEGGSTITQQLAKLVYYPDDGRLTRKLPSVAVAFKIEVRYSKAQIMADYLSVVPMGYGLVGAKAASCAYFGHDLATINVAEAAELAGMVQGPSIYDPRRNPERARARRDYAISRMLDVGFISAKQAETARTAPVLASGTCGR